MWKASASTWTGAWSLGGEKRSISLPKTRKSNKHISLVARRGRSCAQKEAYRPNTDNRMRKNAQMGSPECVYEIFPTLGTARTEKLERVLLDARARCRNFHCGRNQASGEVFLDVTRSSPVSRKKTLFNGLKTPI